MTKNLTGQERSGRCFIAEDFLFALSWHPDAEAVDVVTSLNPFTRVLP